MDPMPALDSVLNYTNEPNLFAQSGSQSYTLPPRLFIQFYQKRLTRPIFNLLLGQRALSLIPPLFAANPYFFY